MQVDSSRNSHDLVVCIHASPWSQWEPLEMLSHAWRTNGQGSRLTIATVQFQE